MKKKLNFLLLILCCFPLIVICTRQKSIAKQPPGSPIGKATPPTVQISQTTDTKIFPLTKIQAPIVFDISLRGKTEAGSFSPIPARLEIWPASPGDPNPIRVALFIPVSDQSKLGNGGIFWQSYSPGNPKRKSHYSVVKVQETLVQMDLAPSNEFRFDMMWMFLKERRISVTPKRGTMTFSLQGDRVTGIVQASGVSDPSLSEEPTSIYQAEFSGQKGKLLPPDVEKLKSLKIQSSDSWEQVVTKAIQLRELGLIDRAVESFIHYGKMFSVRDKTASLYSEIAQQFTRNIRTLGLEGGVYIYQIVPNGVASKAGLQVGDIVVQYEGSPISGMDDLVKMRDRVPKGSSLSLTYLRMTKDGQFQPRTLMLTHPLGAGFMPI